MEFIRLFNKAEFSRTWVVTVFFWWKGKDNTDKRPTFLINFAEDGFNLP